MHRRPRTQLSRITNVDASKCNAASFVTIVNAVPDWRKSWCSKISSVQPSTTAQISIVGKCPRGFVVSLCSLSKPYMIESNMIEHQTNLDFGFWCGLYRWNVAPSISFAMSAYIPNLSLWYIKDISFSSSGRSLAFDMDGLYSGSAWRKLCSRTDSFPAFPTFPTLSLSTNGFANDPGLWSAPTRSGDTPADTVDARFLHFFGLWCTFCGWSLLRREVSPRFFSTMDNSHLKIPDHSTASGILAHRKSKVRVSNFSLIRMCWVSNTTERSSKVETEPLSSCFL